MQKTHDQLNKATDSAPKEIDAKPNHIAGCFIFLTILCTVLFLAGFTWWSYHDYKSAIIQISQKEKTPTPIAQGNAEKFAALDRKIGAFSRRVIDKKPATISLSKEELNLAIANYDKLNTLKGALYVTDISDKFINTQIAFEVRAGFEGTRYLNGTMKLRPVIAKGSIFPIAEEIKPATGSAMPEKMTKSFPTFLFTTYRNDESIANVFQHLSSVKLENGKMIIGSDPEKVDPEAIPDDVTMETSRGLLFFGLLVFIFATTLAFMLWYRKHKKNS